MQRATVDDLTIDYVERGVGEPVVLIHAGLCADWFMPLLDEPALAGVPPDRLLPRRLRRQQLPMGPGQHRRTGGCATHPMPAPR
jgi:hypothetical protein